MSTRYVVEYANHHSAGVQLPRVSFDKLADLEFALPPLAEQKRIVAKVEELLAAVNVARERLARVPAILKRFRQAVLGAACSGRLTEDWRERTQPAESAEDLLRAVLSSRKSRFAAYNAGRYREPEPGDRAQRHDGLPEQWALATLDQLACLVTSGSRGWARFYSESGALFIRAEDINSDELRVEESAHVRPPQDAEGRRTRVEPGDLLITITGANVTKSAWVKHRIGEAYVSQHVALARPVDVKLASFLHLWTISPAHGRARLLADAYGAGKPGLNLDHVRRMVVCVPAPAEQREIVRRVQALFTLADAIEKRVAAATARAERLTQAILAKAFRGELVPTEAELARREGRDYERADALLERIRAERAGPERGTSPLGHSRRPRTRRA